MPAVKLIGHATKLVIVNDCETMLQGLVDCAKHDLPDWTVKGFSGIFEAVEQSSIDYLLIDISAVSFITMWEHAYAPICSFIDRHPGTTIIITSGVSRNAAQDVIDQVKEHSGREVVYGGIGCWTEAIKSLKAAV